MNAADGPPLPASSVTRWHPVPDQASLIREVVQRILLRSQAAIVERGVFRIVLAGGRTPQVVYRKLADAVTDWACWRVYFGDERCLPADDPGRNSLMAGQSWLDRVAIPAGNIFPIRAELGPEQAAVLYRSIVAQARPFDLVLLGMGEDGHTASLFPGYQPAATHSVHPVYHAPRPPSRRVTLGPDALNDAEEVLILVTGSNKHAAIQRWRAGANLPVAHIHGHRGVDVYLDAAADGTTI